MSGASSNHRQPPPTDEELFNLYEEVRRGFQLDSPLAGDTNSTSVGIDVESIIEEYSDAPSPPAQELPVYNRGMQGPTPPAEKVALMTPVPPSPKRNVQARPLPRPPGSSKPSSSTSLSSLNPKAAYAEARPYTSQGTPKTPSPTVSHRPKLSESYLSSVSSHDAIRRGSGMNGGLRPLPVAPEALQPSFHSDSSSITGRSTPAENGRTYGLPASPRPGKAAHASFDSTYPRSLPSPSNASGPSSRPLPSSHQYNVASPSESHSPQQSISSQWSQSNGHTNLNRADSARPRGAQAPAVPGQSRMFESKSKESLYSPTASTSSADMYVPMSPESGGSLYATATEATPQFRPVDSFSSGSTSHLPNLTKSPSRVELDPYSRSTPDIGVGGSSGVPSGRLLDVHIPTTSADDLGRSASFGSTTSSFQSRRVDPVASSSSSPYSPNGNNAVAGVSSRGANIDRGDTQSSYTNDSLYDIYHHGSTSGYVPEASSSRDRQHDQSQHERVLSDIKRQLALHDTYNEEEEVDDLDEDDRFVNLSLYSHVAMRLRDKVPRGTHVKGGIPYARAFTGRDIVSTIQAQIQRELVLNMHTSPTDRRPALQIARGLQSQLFFYEVEWGGRVLQDTVEDVYMFLDDQEGGADIRPEQTELPTGVYTPLTKCYAPSCIDGGTCYAYSCPRRQQYAQDILSTQQEQPKEPRVRDWSELIDRSILRSLPQSEIQRQTIIHKVISKEEIYVQDLDLIETLFMKPLRSAKPPIINPDDLDSFMDDAFHNVLQVRECNRRLLEVLTVRQREQYPIIQKIGDVFLSAAAEFRTVYPVYVGNLPVAEKRLKDELEHNAEFRRFLEQCSRSPESRRMDLKMFLSRPSEHLHKYPDVLKAIYNDTAKENPDADFLLEAINAIQKLSTASQLRTFQAAMGKGPTGKYQWHDLVSRDVLDTLTKKEQKRQAIIFEVIQGEMMYVKDLESIGTMYIEPLRNATPPIIPHDRLTAFLNDVFHNYGDLLVIHRKLLERLHEIQREEHPVIRSVTAPIMDAALNWRDAYNEFIPNYPISHYRIDEEMANNPAFKTFAEQTQRNPDSRRLDMKSFVHRPVARLPRYSLLLTSILHETPPEHEDQEAIPQADEVLRALARETDTAVASAKERVEIWTYNSNLVFKQGEAIDMDLLHEHRTLLHKGKLLRQPDTGFEWSGWTEMFVLLFDNYLVMTKPKEKDGVMKYHVNRRPIPLDLLTIVNFTDPPQQRSKGILGGFRGNAAAAAANQHAETITNGGVTGPDSSASDVRAVFPCTIHHNGRMGGLWTVYAESAAARTEWKYKLDEAILLRKVLTDANKVFEIETLSSDTFLVPSMHSTASSNSWNEENTFTGKVTCSVPFSTPDGRGLVAIGCAEGVWIGLRHDPRSMRRVLHLKMVTQCAMLEDFGIFLVLADKALFAYHIEALVPSSPPNANASRTPQKLNGNKDVQFFTVGTLGGRTLVIYMKKKGLDSVFRVLEPVVGKIYEKTKATGGLSRFGFGSARSEWFRVFRDFFLPSESYDLIFLKAKIAILCSKGFEIMDLTDFKSVTIPQRDDPRFAALNKRCESCKPMGMFRTSENEFLCCYDEFGLYVDRHGDPSRTFGTIEWEGTAERVAWHPPYVLLFDSRFIEIRHVDTGRLVQIIPGNDIRCIWDGRGSTSAPPATPGPDGWVEGVSQEARVHAVMQATEPPGTAPRPSRAVAQHVFQLVPTIPLYLPGSLSSPSNSTYFPQASPPNSPPLTPRNSWR